MSYDEGLTTSTLAHHTRHQTATTSTGILPGRRCRLSEPGDHPSGQRSVLNPSHNAAHHYQPTLPATTHRFGLFDHDQGDRVLVGALTLGVPMNKAVLTRAFPTQEPSVNHVDQSTDWCRFSNTYRVRQQLTV